MAHAVFLDVSAAVDAVWHKVLLKIISALKIRGGSYLQCRIARTTVEGEFSDFVNIKAGDPQFLRRGHILFIIYLNYLFHDPESFPLKYANDTILISSEVDTHKTTGKLNRDL